jgi:hypothetical protein
VPVVGLEDTFAAAVAVLLFAFVDIARAPDETDSDDEADGEDEAEDALNADCARKAAKKFARNGRLVDMMEGDGWDMYVLSRCRIDDATDRAVKAPSTRSGLISQ